MHTIIPPARISDPPAHRGSSVTISLAHPRDPGTSSSTSTTTQPTPPPASSTPPTSSVSAAPPPPPPTTPAPEFTEEEASVNNTPPVPVVPAEFEHHNDPPEPPTNLPSPHSVPHPSRYSHPPFDTHRFFSALERTFPTPTARNLMRATRALLADRVGRVRKEALTVKDIESQAYLFKAALSELRTEITMRTRNESAAMRTATAALRREVDALDGQMKEDLATLKHEIQMEVDSRKNEAKNDVKQMDIQIEVCKHSIIYKVSRLTSICHQLHQEVLNKSLISLGEHRTMMEEVKWDNMRKSVAALGGFLLLIVISMELFSTKKQKPKPLPPPPEIMLEGENMQYTT
ncbi:hypothetical protein NM688_g105 [Phlebia brevispora]|uniref:Uncharacterized protein n=1 Tax=Phlebia brevispora TaxID=194682 RepID=A0ACC1TFA8_9APHY|nr:hypothetical protein NM688_g105 [Phlebia brevispora]